MIRYFKLYQQGQTIILKWVEKYHKFRREYKHLSSDVSVSYLWSEAEVMQLSAGGADWTAPALWSTYLFLSAFLWTLDFLYGLWGGAAPWHEARSAAVYSVGKKAWFFFYDSDKGDAHNRIFLGVNCYCNNIFITTLLQVICLYKGSWGFI